MIATFSVVPEGVWADEVKPKTPPKVSDVAVPGLRLILPGNNGGPGLELPHPVKFKSEKTANASHTPQERNLPMHSSLLSCSLRLALPRHRCMPARRMIWKTCSVEAVAGIGKFRRLGGAAARPVRLGASCQNAPNPRSLSNAL